MQELSSNQVIGKAPTPAKSIREYALVLLPIVGLAISSYLWIAKIGSAALVCGGLSDCVSVNMSIYSTIGGIPIAAAGTMMYLVLTVLGFVTVRQGRNANPTIVLLAFVVALSGALYSLYLTGVEAFVLGAYCIWCVCSWIIITVLTVVWWRTNQKLID